MSDNAARRPMLAPLLLLMALVLVGVLGAGAIALERPVGQANGQVLAMDGGRALAGARVTFSGPVTRTLETDAQGHYRVFNLPVGQYYVAARAKFFDPQWHQSEVTISEGETAKGIDFKLSRTEPTVAVNNTQRVFTPGEPVRVYLRGTQVLNFDVALYRLDVERALDRLTARDPLFGPKVADMQAVGALTPVKNWSQAVRPETIGEDGWFFQAFQMPDLPPGAYLVAFSGTAEQPPGETRAPLRIEEAYWFNVSRLALVTKRADGQFLAYATDFETKRPVAGVRVALRDGKRTLGRAVTGRDGLARLDGFMLSGRLTVLAEHEDSLALVNSYFYGDDPEFRIYAYTDRPVYRPGQQVHFKAVVRAQAHARYTSAAGQSVEVTIKDATGATLFAQPFTVDARGAFDGTITLPEEAPLGDYAIELKANETYEQTGFKVSDYRKPEFKVEITPGKGRYVLGDTADVNLIASYYFGAPVPGAKLLVTVYSAPLYWNQDDSTSFYAGFTDDPGFESYWGYGDVVQQETGVTDAEGKFHLSVPLTRPADGEFAGNRVYTVAVEATDAGGRPVKATQGFKVTQGDFRLSLETDKAVYAPNQPLRLVARAEDYDDKPVATGVTVTIDRLTWNKKKTAEGDEYTETVRTEVYRGSLETGDHGQGTLTVPALGEGSYELTAVAEDAKGHEIQAQAWTWVAGEGDGGGSYGYQALQIVLDKKIYHPGDTARALVVAPVPNLSVLVTLEGTELHGAQVVNLKGTSALVEWPVTDSLKPNAFVSAVAVNGKELMTAERSLNVLPEDKFLDVRITTDKSRYEPGEKATYTVETRDADGKPVAADVSLGVVDEAIYAIEPEHTPDIRGFFHGPRWNKVTTDHSFPEEYSGGLDKNAPDPRVRARFEDTAAWYPSLHTGADGKASVTFTLPDNLTTWIATARAATRATQVGSARHSVVATKDLLVRLETPRFLVEEDQATLSAIAHNYTESPQRVALTLKVEGLALPEAKPQEVELQPGEAKRVTWQVRAERVGEASATVTARSLSEPGAGDAMRLSWPMLPYGLEDVAVAAGEAKPDAPATASLTLPEGAIPQTVGLTVQLRTGPLPVILSAVDYLHHYEYGCVEQTMSRFLPDVAVERRLRALGAPTGDRFADRDERIKDGIRKLLAMQHGDGAWGWWTHDESNLEMTSYVLYGLAEAKAAGYAVPEAAVKRGTDYLVRQLPRIKKDYFTRHTVQRDAGADKRAFALFALAHWNRAPKAELDRLWGDRRSLTPFGAAQFTLALARGGDFRRLEMLDLLDSSVKETESQAFWPADAQEFAWQDNSVEATAYALRAHLAVSPNGPLVIKAARWLESENVRGHWESTKDTGAAAIALAEAMAVRKPNDDRFVAHVKLNGDEIASYAAEPGVYDLPPAIALSADALKKGANTLEVAIDGTGSLDWVANLRYVAREDRFEPAPADGLTITRDYFLLPADVYARQQGQGTFANFYDEDLVKTLPRLGDRVKSGERVLVRLTLKSERAFRYMALEDPLPAGCEILEDQPPNWGYWWAHQEYRDELAAFFFNHLGKGSKTLYYVMRPTTPGQYRVLPPTVWAMYTPEVRARGAGSALTITE